MSTPTQKHTSSRKRTRRGQIKAKAVSLISCPQCKQPKRPHRACPHCGYYKGRPAIKVRVPKKLRRRGQREKEAKK